MDPIYSGSESNVILKEQLFTESESDRSNRGLFDEVLRRLGRRLHVKLQKEFQFTERLSGRLGARYTVNTGRAEPIAAMHYKMAENVTGKIGWKELKISAAFNPSLKGLSLGIRPSISLKYEEQFGVNLCFDNCLPVSLLAFGCGRRIHRKITQTVTPQTERTSGLDLKFRYRAMRNGRVPDIGISDVTAKINLGPPILFPLSGSTCVQDSVNLYESDTADYESEEEEEEYEEDLPRENYDYKSGESDLS